MSFPFFLCLTTTLAISLFPFPPTTADIAADRAALLALRSAVGGRALLWNLSEPDTCLWPGVQCSPNKKFVIELHLPGTGLSGKIPPATIANLTGLQTLSLRYNALSGALPPDIFSSLRDLRNVFLQHNFFSGEIPGVVFSLPSLVRLNLAHNNFSGPLPPSINNLTRLATLYLQENRFSGSIPELHLPGLVQFNASNNQLTGSIPGGLSGQPKSAFQGNSLCGPPLDLCGNNNKSKKNKLSGGAIAGIAIGSVVGLLLILLILFLLCKKRGEKRNPRSATVATSKQTEIEIPPENSARSADVDGGRLAAKQKGISGDGDGKHLVFFTKTGRSFDLDDLLKASAEVLGKGTFGTAYKAVLEMGLTMVVKRLRDVSVPEKEFRAKIEQVGKMNNEFLVPLRAYYYSRDEKLLVYDYISMGSLSALLHGNKGGGRTPLNWETRAAIALNSARGIEYLHSIGPSVSHGNVKSSNILLTKSYEARVSDFGLAQLIGPSSTPNRVDGYRAPEVTDSRKVSQKADVYSFGVLLLELLTGKAPTHSLTNEEGVDLPRWVQSIVREEWTAEVFDLELLRYQNVEEDMVKLLQVAVDCTAQYPDKRPSMAEVTSQIEEVCRSSFQDSRGDIIDDIEEPSAP